MSNGTALARDSLDDKANRTFAGKVVRKDLVRKVKVGANVPVFVLEFLLGKYCASSDEVSIQMGLQVVNDTLANNYIRSDESMKAQATVKDRGRHTFIDKVKVRIVDSDYWAEVSNFGHKNVHIPEHYVREESAPYSALLTGGTTVANLFGHMCGRQKGMVQIWDVVGFDEVADLQKMPKEVITTMKTFCESGSFQRGQEAVSGDASIAMFGNTNQPVEVMVQTGHLFAPMPDIIRDDMAFIDRMHFYLPGWEIPKMQNNLFTDHYGFVVDYLAEALRDLRKHNFTEHIDRVFALGPHLNARDRK